MTSDIPSILHYKANDVPRLSTIFFLGCQQMMCCISGLLVAPFIAANLVCAGSQTVTLRVQLISTTFVVTGLSTLLQTTFGLRLAILQGPSFAFLAPLITFLNLPEYKCNASEFDVINESNWMHKMQMVEGSLFAASLSIVICGATGLMSKISKMLGPITICPLLTLLAISTVKISLNQIREHWISIVQIITLLCTISVLCDILIPIPVFKCRRKFLSFTKVRLFGLFPYLISIGFTWIVCFILTFTDLEPIEGKARIDKNVTMNVLWNSPWFRIPYPGQFGAPKFNLGLTLGFLASCVVCMIESLGGYATVARVSEESTPPSSAINRAILVEGVGCCLASLMGICYGVTTYSENIAVISVTKVASRITMQMAGILLILFGIFSKVGALLATIPDPCVGGILIIGMSMIQGVGLSSLQLVDLKLSRNLTILGTAILFGILIPEYFETNKIETGIADLDQMLNILLRIPMFVGGMIAFVLDNTIKGASYHQRGLRNLITDKKEVPSIGFALPTSVNKIMQKLPCMHRLPFMPSNKTIETSEQNANIDNNSNNSLVTHIISKL